MTRLRRNSLQIGEGYELNFENAAVATVAKVVLGDILHVGYTIDPRVPGNGHHRVGATGTKE